MESTTNAMIAGPACHQYRTRIVIGTPTMSPFNPGDLHARLPLVAAIESLFPVVVGSLQALVAIRDTAAMVEEKAAGTTPVAEVGRGATGVAAAEEDRCVGDLGTGPGMVRERDQETGREMVGQDD